MKITKNTLYISVPHATRKEQEFAAQFVTVIFPFRNIGNGIQTAQIIFNSLFIANFRPYLSKL